MVDSRSLDLPSLGSINGDIGESFSGGGWSNQQLEYLQSLSARYQTVRKNSTDQIDQIDKIWYFLNVQISKDPKSAKSQTLLSRTKVVAAEKHIRWHPIAGLCCNPLMTQVPTMTRNDREKGSIDSQRSYPRYHSPFNGRGTRLLDMQLFARSLLDLFRTLRM